MHLFLNGYKHKETVFFDDKDWELIKQYRWNVFVPKKPNGRHVVKYAIGTKGGKRVRMHSLILGKKAGMGIDHINGNGLDNRRSNIRHATSRDNALNTYKNRHWDMHGVNKFHDKYQSKISINNKQIHLGSFLTKEEAAAAYEAARKVAAVLY